MTERLKAVSELKVLSRVAENLDPVVTKTVSCPPSIRLMAGIESPYIQFILHQ
jgi:hypothetical protein